MYCVNTTSTTRTPSKIALAARENQTKGEIGAKGFRIQWRWRNALLCLAPWLQWDTEELAFGLTSSNFPLTLRIRQPCNLAWLMLYWLLILARSLSTEIPTAECDARNTTNMSSLLNLACSAGTHKRRSLKRAVVTTCFQTA